MAHELAPRFQSGGGHPRVTLANVRVQRQRYRDFAIGEGGELVSKIAAQDCKVSDSSTYTGGWLLEFNQP